MPSKVILVVGEDGPRRSLNSFGLRCAGFSVDEVYDTESAVAQIARRCPDLLLLVASHLTVETRCFVGALRDHAYTRDLPVLTIVARAGEFDVAAARAWGIDDQLFEPVSPHALIERVSSALHRADRFGPTNEAVAGLCLDDVHGVVRRGSRIAPLGPTERRLLEFFLEHPGQVISRSLLLFRIWGRGPSQRSRIVDVNVCRVRRALGELGCGDLLQTVNRYGYRFRAPAAPRASHATSPAGRDHDALSRRH